MGFSGCSYNSNLRKKKLQAHQESALDSHASHFGLVAGLSCRELPVFSLEPGGVGAYVPGSPLTSLLARLLAGAPLSIVPDRSLANSAVFATAGLTRPPPLPLYGNFVASAYHREQDPRQSVENTKSINASTSSRSSLVHTCDHLQWCLLHHRRQLDSWHALTTCFAHEHQAHALGLHTHEQEHQPCLHLFQRRHLPA